MRPLIAFLRTLPIPSTFPSHPASQAIFATLQEAQRGYADMRGVWSRKCLEGQGKRLVERTETLEGVRAGREVGQWADQLLMVAEVTIKNGMNYTSTDLLFLTKVRTRTLRRAYYLSSK